MLLSQPGTNIVLKFVDVAGCPKFPSESFCIRARLHPLRQPEKLVSATVLCQGGMISAMPYHAQNMPGLLALAPE